MNFDDAIRRQTSEFQAALEKGNKIQCIKMFREQTGASLKVAKDFVDELSAARDAQRNAVAEATSYVSPARRASYREFPRLELEDYLRSLLPYIAPPAWQVIQTLIGRVARSQFEKGVKLAQTDDLLERRELAAKLAELTAKLNLANYGPTQAMIDQWAEDDEQE